MNCHDINVFKTVVGITLFRNSEVRLPGDMCCYGSAVLSPPFAASAAMDTGATGATGVEICIHRVCTALVKSMEN